jgi:hypothetical protein
VSRRDHILAHNLGAAGNKATLFDATTAAAVVAVFGPYATAYLHP